ncbi:MAG: molybdopterin molybdotransferase MoeA [Desulfobacterales bacterium]|nr:molybdopterin molybdotransferase MoeA [Desulfobacterales bacterium]
MKDFFKVADLNQVLGHAAEFPVVETESVSLAETTGRILAQNILSDINIPGFTRSTMDGYAVCAVSTFGASEANPAYLTVKGAVEMGQAPDMTIGPGEAASIPTGGMLPDGADSVIMIEHTEKIDDTTIEIYKSVAPGGHVVEKGEDIKQGADVLSCGRQLRPQETGLLAALGKTSVNVFKKPKIAIISTGNEIISIDKKPEPGQIRDINSYSLSSLVETAGGQPVPYGIVTDNYDALFDACSTALKASDMLLISGGSSVGAHDYTVEVLSSLPDAGILAHGISISPGKPTILAVSQNKAVWGLPGHVVSAMVVFEMVVKPFIRRISGRSDFLKKGMPLPAILSRNISSAQGRMDYIRVRLTENGRDLLAEPILGKSGLINTMVQADGLIEIGTNTEGLNKGDKVNVIPL